MKKLFEKKPMLHYTFVLMVISIACGIVIGGVNAVTAPVIADNLLKAKVEAYEEVLPGIDTFDEIEVTEDYPTSIQSIAKGYNVGNDVLGHIYEVYGTNSYGKMTIVVSVGLDGKIIGAQFVTIEQTLNVPGTRTNLSLYVGSNITALEPSGDFISGATGSLSTVQGLLADVATAHALTGGEVIVDPLDEAYGEGYTLEVDNSFVSTDYVTSKSNVLQGSNVVGYVYSLTGSGDYQDGESDSIVMNIYFDADDKIVKIDLPADSYNHTGGGFKNKNIAYLELFIGLEKADIQATIDGADSDITAGASNTNALIVELLEAFLSEVA
ncbi:hypothetical protein BK011_00870 [Tenericutes bacterium MZ-XQ]|nr:hypothetical protein BK011_00870 [Tenericutes bacterium MZ-XQ]